MAEKSTTSAKSAPKKASKSTAQTAAAQPVPTPLPVTTTTTDEAKGGAGKLRQSAADAGAKVKTEARAFRDQATDKAREMASQGKDRTTEALENVARLIGDTASTIDERIGTQYGDYTRKAADAVSGFATDLRGKDVDDIVRDAGAFVKKSPAVAIGAAAAVGFVLARLIKSASDASETENTTASTTSSSPANTPDKFPS